ncbi:hypothetical protein C7212DRAFT_349032, partial [Tuber magnatum]
AATSLPGQFPSSPGKGKALVQPPKKDSIPVGTPKKEEDDEEASDHLVARQPPDESPSDSPESFSDNSSSNKESEHTMSEGESARPPGPWAGRTRPKIKLPLPPSFSGEKNDLKPAVFDRWVITTSQYLALHGVDKTKKESGAYFGSFCTGKAEETYYQAMNHYESGDKIRGTTLIKYLRERFHFLRNSEELYKRFKDIQQYTLRQRLYEAMHPRLRQEVEPVEEEGDSFEKIVKWAERKDAILYETGVYQTHVPQQRNSKGSSSRDNTKKDKPYRKDSKDKKDKKQKQ